MEFSNLSNNLLNFWWCLSNKLMSNRRMGKRNSRKLYSKLVRQLLKAFICTYNFHRLKADRRKRHQEAHRPFSTVTPRWIGEHFRVDCVKQKQRGFRHLNKWKSLLWSLVHVKANDAYLTLTINVQNVFLLQLNRTIGIFHLIQLLQKPFTSFLLNHTAIQNRQLCNINYNPIKIKVSPILFTPCTFPHVQAEDKLRTFLVVTCELFATFAGHKFFQLVQLHLGVAMNTFIGKLFRRNLSLAHFTATIKKTEALLCFFSVNEIMKIMMKW